ncbi:hypothetical protein EVAR_10983_1 [Eumeta japonica]|uniref:Uncharacterized protein n=1 Tax=Eumeta variegata TaxID=151549 RepID=A0A4C1U774_EUMVA|nr:hypothetical protein EVAR_10983_1 [Eumeta japonica]
MLRNTLKTAKSSTVNPVVVGVAKGAAGRGGAPALTRRAAPPPLVQAAPRYLRYGRAEDTRSGQLHGGALRSSHKCYTAGRARGGTSGRAERATGTGGAGSGSGTNLTIGTNAANEAGPRAPPPPPAAGGGRAPPHRSATHEVDITCDRGEGVGTGVRASRRARTAALSLQPEALDRALVELYDCRSSPKPVSRRRLLRIRNNEIVFAGLRPVARAERTVLDNKL